MLATNAKITCCCDDVLPAYPRTESQLQVLSTIVLLRLCHLIRLCRLHVTHAACVTCVNIVVICPARINYSRHCCRCGACVACVACSHTIASLLPLAALAALAAPRCSRACLAPAAPNARIAFAAGFACVASTAALPLLASYRGAPLPTSAGMAGACLCVWRCACVRSQIGCDAERVGESPDGAVPVCNPFGGGAGLRLPSPRLISGRKSYRSLQQSYRT